MRKGDTSIGRLSPERSSTAQGRGLWRALALHGGHVRTVVGSRCQGHNAVFLKNSFQIGARGGVTGVGVEIDAGLRTGGRRGRHGCGRRGSVLGMLFQFA